jgi:hypothetical protein
MIDPLGFCAIDWTKDKIKQGWNWFVDSAKQLWEKVKPDAFVISLSGAGFLPAGAGGGVELVYIPGEGWVTYVQGGLGAGVPGGGVSLEVGPIWNLKDRKDYTGPFIEVQGGIAPVSGSLFGWPGGPRGFKVGGYFGSPGVGVIIEGYIDVEKTYEATKKWVSNQKRKMVKEIDRALKRIYRNRFVLHY